ncbi:MAG: DUF1573 domain-containing protein [Bacteroidales bacterium]|nr:DUF1573 domain-containing protein [Bacteroidales bacterium]
MKKIITVLLIIFFSSLTVAKSQSSEGAVIYVRSVVYDYGTIMKNDDGTGKIVFSNTGNAPLIISNVRTSCGCTVPTWPREPILPGDSSYIEVKYDTRRIGQINRQITINSNASQPNLNIRLRGNVVAEPEEQSPVKPIDNTSVPVNQ